MELLLDLLERCEKLDTRGWYRAKEELAALREAGEKMHSLVKEFLSADENTMLGLMVIDALAEWEAANK